MATHEQVLIMEQEEKRKSVLRRNALVKMRQYIDNVQEGELFTTESLRAELTHDELHEIHYNKGLEMYMRARVKDKLIDWDGKWAMKL